MSTTAVSRREGGRLPTIPREPTFSPPVEAAVKLYLDYVAQGSLGRFGVPVLPAHLRQRAADFVATADAEARPADGQTVRAWLAPIAAAVRVTPMPEDFTARVGAVAVACEDLPGWGFNVGTQRAAMGKFTWFPSAADVREMIAAETGRHTGRMRALRALAAVRAPPGDEVATPMAQEQREAVACGLRALVEERQAAARLSDAGPMARREVRASYPKPEILAAMRNASPIVQATRADRAAKGST